jgi:hypothetical protein
MHPKEGQEGAVADLLRQWERERRPNVPGAVAGYLLKPRNGVSELVGVAVFDSESNYRKNADDPEQDRWYRQLRDLLEADPEWNDGDILVAL